MNDNINKISKKQIEKEIKSRGSFFLNSSIQEIIYFSVDERNYAIVVNRGKFMGIELRYAVWLIEYKKNTNKKNAEIVSMQRFPETTSSVPSYNERDAFNKAIDIELEKRLELGNGNKLDFNKEVRNVLIFGCTGNGKSALANVISGTNNFKESSGSVSETKETQGVEFEIDGLKYCLIDTIGVGDTNLWSERKEEVLARILSAATRSLRDGLSQVLFVTKGKLTEEIIESYKLLRMIIFDENIGKHTTIVRTDFPEFRETAKLYEDCKKMIRESDKIIELLSSCKDIIYVNNPPLAGKEEEIETNKSARRDSQEILRNYLISCEGIYQPKEDLNNLTKEIDHYNKQLKVLDKRITEVRENDSRNKTLLTFYEERRRKLTDSSLQRVEDYVKNRLQQQDEKNSSNELVTRNNNNSDSLLTNSSVPIFAGVILGTFAKSFVNTLVPGLAEVVGSIVVSVLKR